MLMDMKEGKKKARGEILKELIKKMKQKQLAGLGDEELSEEEMSAESCDEELSEEEMSAESCDETPPESVEKMADGEVEVEEEGDPKEDVKRAEVEGEEDENKVALRDFIKGHSKSPHADGVTVSVVGLSTKKPAVKAAPSAPQAFKKFKGKHKKG